MRTLLYKEFKLALHPAAILFLFLAAMLMIPHYPYFVVFFYMCLGVFFICLTGRENNDIYYTMLLPVRKKDIVSARIGMVVLLEALQVLLAVPFAGIRNGLFPQGNDAGMDPNAAFFGFALMMLGLFNLVFFTRYYKDPDKVGKSFLLGCVALGVFICAVEAATAAIPLMHRYLDTLDTQYLPFQLPVLAAGVAVFAILTWIARQKSVRSFERYDL